MNVDLVLEQMQSIRTIKELLFCVPKILEGYGIPESRLETEIMLSEIMGVKKDFLYTNVEFPITRTVKRELIRILERRIKREPLAYILEHREFYSTDFWVTPDVMIPRPETEILVDYVIDYVKKHRELQTIVDVGTGCGSIAINLGLHFPEMNILATDISFRAVEIAKANAERCGVENVISFFNGDLLDPINGSLHIVVANLPYIPSCRLNRIQEEVKWEPQIALDGGTDGLCIMQRLLSQCRERLICAGLIIMEMDPEQIRPMFALAEEYFPRKEVFVQKDFRGMDRFLAIH